MLALLAATVLSSIRFDDAPVVELSGTRFQVIVTQDKWVLRYAGNDPRILARAQDLPLSQDDIADLLFGLADAIGTGRADEAAHRPSVNHRTLKANSDALSTLIKDLPSGMANSLTSKILADRSQLDANGSYSQDRLTSIDGALTELKTALAQPAPAAATTQSTPPTSTPATGTPTPATPAVVAGPNGAPTVTPAPVQPSGGQPIAATANVAPAVTRVTVPAPNLNAIPVKVAGNGDKPVPAAPPAVKAPLAQLVIAVIGIPAPTDATFGGLYASLPVDAGGLNTFDADGTVKADQADPVAALVARAAADLDDARAPLEPRWSRNVNPFFWIRLFAGGGEQLYQGLRDASGAGLCPIFPFLIETSKTGDSKAALANGAVETAFKVKDLPKVEKVMAQTVTAVPSAASIYNQALVEGASFNTEAAIRLFRSARTLGLPGPASTAAKGYADQLGQLTKLLELPEGSKTRIFREQMDAANVFLNAGLFKEAVSYACQASVIDVARPDPYILAARVCLTQNRKKDAVLWAQHAAEHLSSPTHERIVFKLIKDLTAASL